MENRVKKMTYSKDLETEKNLLIKRLKECNQMIEECNQMIKENQTNCNHIGVYLGEKTCEGQANSPVVYCLLCGKKLDAKSLIAGSYIDGSMYDDEYDVNSEAQCADRFDTIRVMASGIIGFNPSITDEQLIKTFDKMHSECVIHQTDESKPVQKKIEM